MKYIPLLYHADWPTDPSPEGLQAWEVYTTELQKAGVMVAAAALQLAGTACTVRGGDSGPVTTDGPFAETKEQLGGYYIVDVATRDEAAAWAAKVPSVAHGGTGRGAPSDGVRLTTTQSDTHQSRHNTRANRWAPGLSTRIEPECRSQASSPDSPQDPDTKNLTGSAIVSSGRDQIAVFNQAIATVGDIATSGNVWGTKEICSHVLGNAQDPFIAGIRCALEQDAPVVIEAIGLS